MFVVLACLQPLLLPGRTGANAPAGPAPNNSSLAMPSEGSEKAMGAGALGSRRAEEGVAPTLGPPLASDVAATVPIAAPPSPGRIEEVTAGTSAGTTPDIAGALAELGGAAQKQERERQQAGIVAGGAPELVHGGASSNRAGDVELGTDSVGSREGPTDTAAAPASNMGSRRGGPSLHQQEVQTVEMSSSAKPTEIAASPRPSLLQPGPNSPVTRQAAEAQPNLSGAPGEGGGRLSEGKPWGGTSERELLVGAALHGGATSSGECPPPVRPPLKVFMYELPQKFNFGLFTKDPLGPDGQRVWSGTSVPSWPSRGGLRYQHSITYFLMADLVTPPHQRAAGSAAVRVLEPAEADVFFVPFFASLSFNTFGRSMKDPEALKDKALQVQQGVGTGPASAGNGAWKCAGARWPADCPKLWSWLWRPKASEAEGGLIATPLTFSQPLRAGRHSWRAPSTIGFARSTTAALGSLWFGRWSTCSRGTKLMHLAHFGGLGRRSWSSS